MTYFCEDTNEQSFGLHRRREIYRQGVRILASHEQLFMVLVRYSKVNI
jgi:hypothetical protein